MNRLARVSAVAAFVVLMVIGLFTGDDPRILTRTSFGQVAEGHGALYEMLRSAGVPVARSYAPPERLAPARTIWWIEPDLAAVGPDPSPDPSAGPAPSPLAGESLAGWIAAGGTAVVLLSDGAPSQLTLAGIAVPATNAISGIDAAPTQAPPEPASQPPAEPASPRLATARGPIVSAARAIELQEPRAFVSADPERWRVVAQLDGHPFALETALGAGRLAVVADARFVSNGWLDRADAAPLAADLVRAYGDPWIDEHEHGLVASRSAVAYLARSAALPFFVGLALLALAFAWFGAALPRRSVREHDPSAPTLEDFVASLARLYARTRDYPRVLERYRELTARRLRRQLGLPPDAPIESLTERLGRRRGLSAAGLALLAHGSAVRSEAELERAAAALNRLVQEVS